MKLKKIISSIIICIIIIQLLCISYATEENIQNETQVEEQVAEEEEMKIYSEAAILMEEKTGKILYEKNIHERKNPASTTKILTAILAIENCDLNETATASHSAVTSLKSGYTKADIQVGESFTIDQLISVMMIQSANEAANVIAEHISGSVSEFSNLMNKKAKEIGCLDTHFVNPNGMHNENHYSTAYDLALIARYCMKNEKFRKYCMLEEASLPRTEQWGDEQIEKHGERIFKNTNNLMQKDNKYYYPTCIGIKSGFTTPAKNCLISASNKNGFEVVSVILHAEATDDNQSARYVDTINLFNYGYENYNLSEIYKEYNFKEEIIEEPEGKNISATNVDVYDDTNDEGGAEKKDDKLVTEIDISNDLIKIVLGIILVIVSILIVFKKRNEGKHCYQNDLYKFNLDSEN